jgi:hypothetical protein
VERLLGSLAARVFSGRLHPSEMAARLAREADLARFEHDTGVGSANVYRMVLNPRDLGGEASQLELSLAEEVERHAADEGLRLEGPVEVSIAASAEVPPGTIQCHVEVLPGPERPWAVLAAAQQRHHIARNRSLVGRSGADVSLAHEDISRRHALIWRQGGRSWIRDLGSANGTTVDGKTVGDTPVPLEDGSAVGIASHRYRFQVL